MRISVRPNRSISCVGQALRRRRPDILNHRSLAWLSWTSLVAAVVAGCASPGASPTPAASSSAVASVVATETPRATPALSLSPTATLAPLTFVVTGNMHTARFAATATLLENGKVLIAGGENVHTSLDIDVYSSAELYDPSTGKFTNTGSMRAARAYATAVRLSDGRVLIAGGEGCSDGRHCTGVSSGAGLVDLASAEIYDPSKGSFTPTGSMAAPRAGALGVLLADGRVFVAGFTQSAELYDPLTGGFAAAGKKQTAYEATSVALVTGKTVLLAGFVRSGGEAGQLFDEETGKYTNLELTLPAGAAAFPVPAVPSAALTLPDGHVLLFTDGYIQTCDPSTNAVVNGGPVTNQGEWDSADATLLADGRVLVEGGGFIDPNSGAGQSTNAAVLYEPSNGSIAPGSMNAARQGQTATLLLNGSVLIAGGEDASYKPLASAELFEP